MRSICTSNYDNCRSENGISISGDRGKKVNFTGPSLSMLAPKKNFWNIYNSNIGKISEEDNIKYYISEYYKQVLSKLDPEKILDLIPKEGILLCYEDSMKFCHRHLVAFWFELFLGIKTFEVYENHLCVGITSTSVHLTPEISQIFKTLLPREERHYW